MLSLVVFFYFFVYHKTIVGSFDMGQLRWVGSLKLQVSFAKEPCKRDEILQKRLLSCITRQYLALLIHSHLFVHTYTHTNIHIYTYIYTYIHVYTYTHINTHTHTYTHAHTQSITRESVRGKKILSSSQGCKKSPMSWWFRLAAKKSGHPAEMQKINWGLKGAAVDGMGWLQVVGSLKW